MHIELLGTGLQVIHTNLHQQLRFAATAFRIVAI